jgi:hypothetical protein
VTVAVARPARREVRYATRLRDAPTSAPNRGRTVPRLAALRRIVNSLAGQATTTLRVFITLSWAIQTANVLTVCVGTACEAVLWLPPPACSAH